MLVRVLTGHGFVVCAVMLFFCLIEARVGRASQWRTTEQQTALIELYTSEGCSSCPPAEEWLSHLKNNPDLWTKFVPVAFHVDYWNNLGWRDRFASAQFTARQRNYAALWHGDSVYTPAFVLNGHEWRDWSMGKPFSPSDHAAGILTASWTDAGDVTATFVPAADQSGPWTAHVALLGCGLSSKVNAGENRGHNLQHDFVVLDYKTTAMQFEGGNARASLLFPGARSGQKESAGAVWISRGDDPKPLQATGGWLTATP